MDLTVTAAVAALMHASLTPDVGGGFHVAGGIRRGWFSVELEIRMLFAPTGYYQNTETGADRPFDLLQVTGNLVPCAHFLTYFGVCGVAAGGLNLINTPNDIDAFPQINVGPRVRLSYPFAEDRFQVFGFGDVLVNIVPSSIGSAPLLPSGESPPGTWVQPRVSVMFGLGFQALFH